MKKLVVLLFLILLVGCAQPPPFTFDTCVTECNQCGLDCATICSQLQIGFDSVECHDASQNVWLCAIGTGCNFPTMCSQEVTVFLSCSP